MFGLGYVGLPLAVALGRYFPVLGFDVDSERLKELARGHDRTREVAAESLLAAGLQYSDEPDAHEANLRDGEGKLK